MLTLAAVMAWSNNLFGQGVIRGSIHYYDSPASQLSGNFPFYDLDQSNSTDLIYETQGVGGFRLSPVNPASGRIALRPDSSLAPLAIGDVVSMSSILGMGLIWGGPRQYTVGSYNSDTGVSLGVISEGVPLYLGFQFTNGGNTYNGWLEINGEVLMQRLAYNTIPNGPIAVGQVPEPQIVVLLLSGVLAFMGTHYARKRHCPPIFLTVRR